MDKRPEVENLLGIYSALKDEKFDDVMKEMSGKDFSSFKKLLSELTIDKIPTFRYFSIKLIGTGTNQAQPPRVKNLRVLALA